MKNKKKYLFGLYSEILDANSGIIKCKILGITIRKKFNKSQQCLTSDSQYDIDEMLCNVKQFYNYIINHCQSDCFNLVLHRHLGDSFVLLCLKDYFEKKYGKKLYFFVKPRQEILMKIFSIENYTVFDITKFLDIRDYTTETDISKTQYIDKIEENLYINLFPSIPLINTPFICNPIDYIKNRCPYKNFIHGWSIMLGLDIKQVSAPKLNIKLSNEVLNKLNNIDLNKIICFAPEANSCKEINIEFWNLLAEQLTLKGYSVIVNSVNRHNKIKFANYFNFSLYDFIAISKSAKAVFTIRSGLADILANVSQNCFVFSTEDIYQDYFYMNKIFKLPYKVNEIRINTGINSKDAKKVLNNILNQLK